VGGPGGSRTKLNGTTCNLDYFINAWRIVLTPLYPLLLQYHALGWFFGQSLADDVTSSSLWNRVGGIPMAELATAFATIKADFPGLRYGARMRPSQAPFDIGADFYYAQYSFERGAAGPWAAAEYTLSLARSAYLIPSLNYLHGGSGTGTGDFPRRYANGTIKGQGPFNWMCSPTEVATYIPTILAACLAVDGTAAKIAGFLGYQYLAEYLTLADSTYTMLEALAIAHDALAGLPALP
jgi:hypothetical protein